MDGWRAGAPTSLAFQNRMVPSAPTPHSACVRSFRKISRQTARWSTWEGSGKDGRARGGLRCASGCALMGVSAIRCELVAWMGKCECLV